MSSRAEAGALTNRSVISACREPSVSVAGVALANGLNANQVHRWMRERGIEPPSRRTQDAVDISGRVEPGFMPVHISAAVEPVIRIDALWLSAAPLDMRAGMDTLLAQVVRAFGQAQPHHAYLFSNRRGTRLKVLVHDGFGVWLACRRLNQGRFHWSEGQGGVALPRAQFDALVLGLPWRQLDGDGVIRIL